MAIQIVIADKFSKEVLNKNFIRCRSKNKEKSDLTPLDADNIKPVVGVTPGSAITVNLNSHVKGVALQRKVQEHEYGVNKLYHKFVGYYDIDKLTGSIEKSIKRDLMALVLQKSHYIEIKIYVDDLAQPFILRRQFCTNYENLYIRLKNIILKQLKFTL